MPGRDRRHHSDIGRVLARAVVHDDTSFTVGGARYEVASSDGLTESLAAVLYQEEYLRRSDCPVPAGIDAGAFQKALSRISEAPECWESGWTLVRKAPGRMVMRQYGVEFAVEHSAVTEPTTLDEAQAPLAVRAPRVRRNLLPGYVAFAGAHCFGFWDQRPRMLRVYWNADPEGALLLASLLAQGLDKAGVPFAQKLLAHPRAYDRADSVVLYLDQSDYGAAQPVLAHAWRRVRPHLRDATPLLTLPLAAGLALAEDPGGAKSFGLHRCGLLAQALVDAQRSGRGSRHREDAVARIFAAEGLDTRMPHLQPGGRGGYLRFPAPRRPPARPRHRIAGRPQASAGRTPSALAVGLAQSLQEQALWSNDRCNWIGSALEQTNDPLGSSTRLTTLGRDLYAGLAGVGLFLAEASAHVTGTHMSATAAGALHLALDMSARAPVPNLDFYTGDLGVAVAAIRAGRLCRNDALVARGIEAADTLSLSAKPGAGPDLVGGLAGAICGLLLAASHLSSAAARAEELGEELLATASADTEGRAVWRNPTFEFPPLCGLAHGASGIALAFLALFSRTGSRRWRDAALDAFAYEDRHFERGEGNWPDLRSPRSGPSMVAWCHGAAGILLARRAAFLLDPDNAGAHRSALDLATTAVVGEAERLLLARDGIDGTFCHGVIGIGYALHAAALTGAAPADAADTLVGRVLARPQEMHSGVPGGLWHPSLFLGVAGAGLGLLRLEHPTPAGDPFFPIDLSR